MVARDTAAFVLVVPRLCHCQSVADMRLRLITIILFALRACGVRVFIEEPLPLNVTTENFAKFRCKHTGADLISWRVNGTSVGNGDFSNIYTSTKVDSDGILVHILTIQAFLDYNGTQVDCVVFTINPHGSEFSPNVTLSIQGPLQAVKNPAIEFNSREFKLTWEAPFSLDLTDVDPDIIYCVQMLNTTCGTRSVLIDDCNIFEEELNLTSFSQHYVYDFIITPRSNVLGATNGTTATLQVEFAKYQVVQLNVSFNEVLLGAHVQFTMTEETDSRNAFTAEPTLYSVLLVSVDGIGEETMTHELTIDEITENSVKLSIPAIPRRRLWNYTILAYECTQHPLIATSELSTHDVQNISISSTSPGEIEVSGSLICHTTVVGLLVILYTLEPSETNTYYFMALQNNGTSTITASFQGLPGSLYGVSVFILEESGLPFERSALHPRKLYVKGGAAVMGPEQSIEYVLTESDDHSDVCVECSFLDDSNEYCIVLIYEKITCETVPCEVGLIDIHTSRKLIRSGSKASGCISGINITNYQLGVIGGRLAIQSTVTDLYNERLYYIALSVNAAALFLVTLILTFCFVNVCRKRYRKKRHYHAQVQKETQVSEDVVHYRTLPVVGLTFGLTDSIRTQISTLSEDDRDLPSYEAESTPLSDPDHRMRDHEKLGTPRDQPHTDSQHDATCSTLTVDEKLYTILLPIAPKWKELGEILSLRQDVLDKIHTHNHTDADCLKLMLSLYILGTDPQQAWKGISAALLKMGEHNLANEINRRKRLLNAEQIPMSESSDGHTAQAILATPAVVYNSLPIEDDVLETGTSPTLHNTQLSYLNKSIVNHRANSLSDGDSDDVTMSYPIAETGFCSRIEQPTSFVHLYNVPRHNHSCVDEGNPTSIGYSASAYLCYSSHDKEHSAQSDQCCAHNSCDSELHVIHNKVPSCVDNHENIILCESKDLNKPLHWRSLSRSSDTFSHTLKEEPVHSEGSVMCENLSEEYVYSQQEQTQESQNVPQPFSYMYND